MTVLVVLLFGALSYWLVGQDVTFPQALFVCCLTGYVAADAWLFWAGRHR